MNIIIGIVGKQNITFNKLEALLRHNNKIFNERRPFNSIYCILLAKQLLIQSSAKPRIPRMFEFIKNIGVVYGVNSFWEVKKNKDIF